MRLASAKYIFFTRMTDQKAPRVARVAHGSPVVDVADAFFAEASARYLTFLFSVSIRTMAAGPEEAGFWPVISRPSVVT
jgi:hypothetical protein